MTSGGQFSTIFIDKNLENMEVIMKKRLLAILAFSLFSINTQPMASFAKKAMELLGQTSALTTVGLGLIASNEHTNWINSNKNDISQSLVKAVPEMYKAFEGIHAPKTWYGSAWHTVKSWESDVSFAFRLCSYVAMASGHIMAKRSVNQQEVEEQKRLNNNEQLQLDAHKKEILCQKESSILKRPSLQRRRNF